jgi:hypothetical protein
MARIKGLEGKEAPLIARVAYWIAKRKVGKIPIPITITAYHPRLLRAYGAMEMGQEAAKTVDFPLKMLAQIKVAMRIGCPF